MRFIIISCCVYRTNTANSILSKVAEELRTLSADTNLRRVKALAKSALKYEDMQQRIVACSRKIDQAMQTFVVRVASTGIYRVP